MRRPTHRQVFVACLVAMARLLALPAASSGESPGTLATSEQTSGRPPDAVLRSVGEGDFNSVIRDILIAAGQPQVTIRLRASGSVKTAAASVHGGQKTIEYNREFIARLAQSAGTAWAAVLLFSHEVAHLLAGHATPRPTSQDDLRSMELEAHRAAGLILARLGASLVESSRSMRAACRLEQTAEAVCTAYEKAVEVGWRASARPGAPIS